MERNAFAIYLSPAGGTNAARIVAQAAGGRLPAFTRSLMRTIHSVAGAVIATCAAFAAVTLLGEPPGAHADPAGGPDDQFLGMLSKDGANVGPPDRLIAIAHERCDADGLSRSPVFFWRMAGASPYMEGMTKIYAELESQGLTASQLGPFMRDAITVYCPQARSR